MNQTSAPDHRCGVVGVVGRPNVGKSTLLNTILGEPIVIVSPRPQTTRHRITCIATRPDAQYVFLDTPGLTTARDPLQRFMQGQAQAALQDVDVVLLVLDAAVGLRPAELAVIETIRREPADKVVALNKIDCVPPARVREIMGALGAKPFWRSLVPISALRGDQVELLLADIRDLLPAGPPLYPPDLKTDRSERFVIAELIREQVFLAARQEVPHATAVVIEDMQEQPNLLRLFAAVIVERDSQKGIVIGKGGERLKQIGTAARLRIERLLATRVFLDLRVRVRKDWRRKEMLLREFGYTD